MAKSKTEIRFSQSTGGCHSIVTTIESDGAMEPTGEIKIDVNELDIADIREVING